MSINSTSPGKKQRDLKGIKNLKGKSRALKRLKSDLYRFKKLADKWQHLPQSALELQTDGLAFFSLPFSGEIKGLSLIIKMGHKIEVEETLDSFKLRAED